MYSLVAITYDYKNEFAGLIKGDEFIKTLNDYQLLNNFVSRN